MNTKSNLTNLLASGIVLPFLLLIVLVLSSQNTSQSQTVVPSQTATPIPATTISSASASGIVFPPGSTGLPNPYPVEIPNPNESYIPPPIVSSCDANQSLLIGYKSSWDWVASDISVSATDPQCSVSLNCTAVRKAAGPADAIDNPIDSKSGLCESYLTQPSPPVSYPLQLNFKMDRLTQLSYPNLSASQHCRIRAIETCLRSHDSLCSPLPVDDPEAACCATKGSPPPLTCPGGVAPDPVKRVSACKVRTTGSNAKYLVNVFGPFEKLMPNPDGIRIDNTRVAYFYCTIYDDCKNNVSISPNDGSETDKFCSLLFPSLSDNQCPLLNNEFQKQLQASRISNQVIEKIRWVENQDNITFERAKELANERCEQQFTARGATFVQSQCAALAQTIADKDILGKVPAYCCPYPEDF